MAVLAVAGSIRANRARRMTGAFITGCEGLGLNANEVSFLREAQPWGLILFARNVDTAEQIKSLTGHFRDIVGRADAPVLIDQEGGRVQRMRPPNWRKYPPGRAYSEAYGRDPVAALRATRLVYRLLAQDLADAGINVDCVPVLDVPQPGAHDIIGDRAYGMGPEQVALLGRAAAQGLMDGGVLPVIKHIPGHGRAFSDSHLELPVVDAPRDELERVDFAPFAALSDIPMAMTAHVVYSALDPDNCCTLSPTVIGDVIRGQIGFDGLIMSDDLSMKALKGEFRQRGERAIAAGCDVLLHCNGSMAEMQEVASAAGTLAGQAQRRATRALSFLRGPDEFDVAAAEMALEKLVGPVA
jgi:beta-N-acetylhexosaminidase